MNLQNLDVYLNYLIHLSNELLGKRRVDTKDIVVLQNEWYKFQSVVRADVEIANSLKTKITAIQISKKNDAKEYQWLGSWKKTWKTMIKSFFHGFFLVFSLREAEKNRQLVMEFHQKLSHLFFDFGHLEQM